MHILALDTSTEQLSVALWKDGDLLSRAVPAGQQHASLTLPLVAELLAEAGTALPNIDVIAYPSGPGSFTGLRIGCGLAQGLAFAHGTPVVGVSTLAALAAGEEADTVYACLDARMGQVYAGAYRRSADDWQAVIEDGLYDPHSLPVPDSEGWAGIGTGFGAYRDILATRLGNSVSVRDPARLPHARELARLAALKAARGETVAAADATLVYLRDKVALKTHERAKP